MQRIINYYRYLNLLSLDVALGAAISALFLTRIFNVEIRFHGLLCLGLTVWLIYTTDHLVDAKMIRSPASTERHRFHQQYFKMILVLAILILLTILPLLFFIYTPVLSMGVGLGALVIIYFVVQRKLGFLKELLGAVLYCVGVMLPVIALSKMSFNSLISVPAILFFNTALTNLILFSWFDREKDLQDNHSSLVTSVGSKGSKGILYSLFVIQLGLIVYAFDSKVEISILLVFVSMYLVLLFIFLKAKWFAFNDRYRLVGDAVFLIPLIYIMFVCIHLP
ncbi:MAG: hypothetical protein KF860_08235 [Cyclobacteriaceae bacterium]|nr:hypothetical protein [Cyclobacteriaceae bacterium]